MKVTKESFLKDVESHNIAVLRDDGVYRHLRFAKPDTNVQMFDIVTWPGTLCYTGDMGTYVFSRLYGMFEFFRDSKGELRINESYWAEKVDASDRDGVTKFSNDAFKAAVLHHCELYEFSKDDLQEVNDELLANHYSNGYAAHDAATNFKTSSGRGFGDFWEYNTTEYMHRYLWCCHAIVWGIGKYNSH